METDYQFMVESGAVPSVELTDAGLYIRFAEGEKVHQTVVQNQWPHIAVDLDQNGHVIGIECVPAPADFTIGKIPQLVLDARVGGLPAYRAEDVRIENRCAA